MSDEITASKEQIEANGYVHILGDISSALANLSTDVGTNITMCFFYNAEKDYVQRWDYSSATRIYKFHHEQRYGYDLIFLKHGFKYYLMSYWEDHAALSILDECLKYRGLKNYTITACENTFCKNDTKGVVHHFLKFTDQSDEAVFVLNYSGFIFENWKMIT